ncbi:hypothetical protein ACFW6F_00245 [Streptomyces sp. NPDC058746]|uniref:hypothetical protein n=1 Tax=Streptomyces sp. NPDC058746 TaxID=3346622 RepID=UPI0036BEB9B2
MTTTVPNVPSEPTLRVNFIDHLIPRATPGRYRVKVHHTLTDAGGELDTPERLPTTEETFEIRAARFVLARPTVHALYPPPGSRSSYGRTLAHITFNRPTLPWERNQAGTRSGPEARPPWVALLVFGADELPDDPGAAGATVLRTVAELRRPAEPGVIGPDLPDGSVSDSEAAGQCSTIDVPAELFTAVAPHDDEMYYLAHVRKVAAASAARADGEVIAPGEYAVVTANRFPRTPGDYVAHLVSFEGFEGRLSGTLPPGTTAVRLASLHHWTFTSSDGPASDPGALLQHLVGPDDPADPDPERLALRLPAAPPSGSDPAARTAYERLRLGYVAVPHRLLSGELTYGWYRGPGTPVTAHDLSADRPEGPHTTSDHALIYDPEHGLFDVSHAAAWTLGRTIGLADPDYTTAVTRARRELANQASALMCGARALPDGRQDGPPALGPLRELAAADFRRTLVDGLAGAQLPDGGGRRAAAAPRTRSGMRALLGHAGSAAVLRETADRNAETIAAWQARLGLLQGVPFNHLVPDPRMLPPESLRMFRIDPGWIDALVAGAADVAVHTSLDAQLAPELARAARRRFPAATAAAGMLIHSALIPAWPDIVITASLGERTLTELRRARPGPRIMMVLWDGVPDKVVLREPGQGIHYGIDAGDRISLRDLTPGPGLGTPLETFYPADGEGTVTGLHLRPGPEDGPAVLRLFGEGGLVAPLARTLGVGDDLDPGQLAIELVNAPLQQEITSPAADHARTETLR